MERVWVKSKVSGAIRQVAESAVPVMRVSGWKPLTKAEVAAHEKALAEARQIERDALRVPREPEPAPPARAEQDKENS